MRNVKEIMDDATDISHSIKVQFGEHKYAFFWTDNAKKRLLEQHISEEEATKSLLKDLEEINFARKANPVLTGDGYFCIRDLRKGFFAVCHLTKQNKRLRVVTYDGTHVLYPREGDLTYQFTATDVLLRIWVKS